MVHARPPCEDGVAKTAGATAAPKLSRTRLRLVLAATVLGSSMAFIDGSVVNVALPALQRDLAAGSAEVQWVMNAYLLTLGALVLIGGAAADRFGRRLIFAIGVALFAAASIACALAPDATLLVAARAVQGVGAALLTPASLAILGSAFPPGERARAIGAWAGFGAVTTALGPVFGGWLVDAVSWRAIFLINLPLAALTLALAWKAIPESRDPEAKGLDIIGAGLAAGGLGLVTWALTLAPAKGLGWPPGMAAIAGGLVALAAFVIFESRIRHPMLQLGLFKSRAFVAVNLLTLLLYFALGGALFFLPFELIRVHGWSATAAGAAFLPFSLVMGLLSSAAGRLSDRIGPRLPLTVGPIIAGAGLLLLGWAADDGTWISVIPAMLVVAAGMTLAVAPLTATVMSSVDEGRAGAASGVNNAAARIAGLLAIAVMSLAFSARFDAAMAERGRNTDTAAPPARGAALTVTPVELAGEAREAASKSFNSAYRLVMLIGAACAAAGGLTAGALIRGEARK